MAGSMHREEAGLRAMLPRNRVGWPRLVQRRCTRFLPDSSEGRALSNANRSLGQPIAMAPDEDWPRRLLTYHTRFARNDRVASDITVVVPVYNTPAAHLDECVRSLLRQTVRPHEILIIDDGTTLAETNTYLNALQDLPELRLMRNDRNISLGPTMNRALQLCQTKILC
jgi:Glycosyl transferase family 2